MKSSDLLRCPCCGGRPWLVDKRLLPVALSRYEREFPHYVMCRRCGVQTQQYHTVRSAVRAWNRRPK